MQRWIVAEKTNWFTTTKLKRRTCLAYSNDNVVLSNFNVGFPQLVRHGSRLRLEDASTEILADIIQIQIWNKSIEQ